MITGRVKLQRGTALLLVASMGGPLLAGCGGSKQADVPPPVDDTRSATSAPTGVGAEPQKKGMSTGKKVALLAGAAALFWLYQHHKNAQGETVQYYKSKNGRIYYRDKDHRAHYVTPPTQPIEVDESQAQEYSRYKGYNNSTTGEDFGGSNLPPGED